jgi:phosphocarrier protein FPr
MRVLEALGIPRRYLGELPEPGILVVEDLTPAEVISLSGLVVGVIWLKGSTTSHAAILLRARGIPAIANADCEMERTQIDLALARQTIAAFDGDTGELWVDPGPGRMKAIRERQERRRLAAHDEARHRYEPAITTDGHRIDVFANLGPGSDVAQALSQGAEGVGLFRTEFLYLDRAEAPAEDEQFAALRKLREVMGARPVVIRTLDIGGDKGVPYLGLAKEANPFLGVRGIRLCLRHRELFEAQLRAILRAGEGGNFRLMFPMISEPAELNEARAILNKVQAGLERNAIPHAWPIPVGIMIEVPSAAMLIEQLAKEADFFSIGTNDLTQYVLAADRVNAELTNFQDALHPAVLRLIRQITVAAHRLGRKVTVCGEAASDTLASRVLVGFGVAELSVTPSRIPAIKAGIRGVAKSELETLSERLLGFASAEQVRAEVTTRES